MNMLFVDPKHHKQGVARQLCDHAIKFLKSKNVAWLWLHAAPNAVDFYLKTGFSDEGSDSVTFEKTITPTTFMQQFL
jgi:predicted N-acetyltransferase YhbS